MANEAHVGGFAVVVGNPPYVDSETMSSESPAVRAAIGAMHRTATGNWDLYIPFVEQAIAMLNEGGMEALVTPSQIMASDYAAPLQALMLQHGLRVCHDFSDAQPFRDADVAVAILAVAKGVGEGPTTFIKYDQNLKEVRRVSATRAMLESLPEGYITAPLTAQDPALLDWLASAQRVEDVAQVSDGATTAEAYQIRDVVEEGPSQPGSNCVRLVNTGTIDPFRILWGVRDIRYLGFSGLYPVIAEDALDQVASRRLQQARVDKVILAGMSNRLEAAVAKAGVLCGKSAVLVIPDGKTMCPHALTAVLNAPSMSSLYRALLGTRGFGSGSMNIGPRQVERMPVPARSLLAPAAGIPSEPPSVPIEEHRLRLALAEGHLLSCLGRWLHRDGALHADATSPLDEDALAQLDRAVRTAFALTLEATAE